MLCQGNIYLFLLNNCKLTTHKFLLFTSYIIFELCFEFFASFLSFLMMVEKDTFSLKELIPLKKIPLLSNCYLYIWSYMTKEIFCLVTLLRGCRSHSLEFILGNYSF